MGWAKPRTQSWGLGGSFVVGVGSWRERLSRGHGYLEWAQLERRGSKESAHMQPTSREQGLVGAAAEAEPAGLAASPGTWS